MYFFKRSTAKRQLYSNTAMAFGLSAIVLGLASAPATAQDVPNPPTVAVDGAPPAPPRQGLTLDPSVGFQGIYTDNARLSPAKSSDFVSGLTGALQAVYAGPRATATLNTSVTYDYYAENHQFNGTALTGYGAGSYKLIDNFLTLNAGAGETTGNATTLGSSTLQISTGNGSNHTSSYYIGPQLDTSVLGFAELTGTAYYEQVFFSQNAISGVTTVTPLSGSSSMEVVSMSADTKDRFKAYELSATGQYEGGENGFEKESTVESAFISVTPLFRYIVRGGYDHVVGNGIKTIDQPLWLTGLEASINRLSNLSLEGGQRFSRPYWVAKADVQLYGRLFLVANYDETVESGQFAVGSALTSFTAGLSQPTTPVTATSFTLNQNLTNSFSLNKVGAISLVYRGATDLARASYNSYDRLDLSTNLKDITSRFSASYERQIRADLLFRLVSSYSNDRGRTALTATTAGTLTSSYFGVNSSIVYNLNSKSSLEVRYGYTKFNEQNAGNFNYDENLVMFILKRQLRL